MSRVLKPSNALCSPGTAPWSDFVTAMCGPVGFSVMVLGRSSRGLCWKCHPAETLRTRLHNTGVGWGRTPEDFGRFEVTGKEEDRSRFKTSTLRDVAKTAPYMHDGSLAALREVVEFYSRGGTPNPNLDPIMKPLQLSETEIQSLVDFLEALTGAGASEPQGKDATRTQ